MTDTYVTPAAAIAAASTEDLLLALRERGALVPIRCQGLIDGRELSQVAESFGADGSTEDEIETKWSQFWADVELRWLEGAARGMAAAADEDRVYDFEVEPAHGDMAPGTVNVSVSMLAVSYHAGDDDAAAE